MSTQNSGAGCRTSGKLRLTMIAGSAAACLAGVASKAAATIQVHRALTNHTTGRPSRRSSPAATHKAPDAPTPTPAALSTNSSLPRDIHDHTPQRRRSTGNSHHAKTIGRASAPAQNTFVFPTHTPYHRTLLTLGRSEHGLSFWTLIDESIPALTYPHAFVC